jgi:hypothetical protein
MVRGLGPKMPEPRSLIAGFIYMLLNININIFNINIFNIMIAFSTSSSAIRQELVLQPLQRVHPTGIKLLLEDLDFQ